MQLSAQETSSTLDQPSNDLSDLAPPTQFLQSLTGWKPHSDPLPADLDEAALDAISAHVRQQQRPATNAEVVNAIRRLRQHYGEWSQLTETEEAEVWRDWCLDFKAYPKAMLEDACRLWRNSTAKKPPTPGQLKEKVRVELDRLTWVDAMLPRARQALNNPGRMWA